MMNRIINSFLPSIILMMPRMFFRGVILYFCWKWFIVPLLLVPAIPLWMAVPISGLVSILTFEKIGQTHSIAEAWVSVGEWAIGATVFLTAAYIFHLV